MATGLITHFHQFHRTLCIVKPFSHPWTISSCKVLEKCETAPWKPLKSSVFDLRKGANLEVNPIRNTAWGLTGFKKSLPSFKVDWIKIFNNDDAPAVQEALSTSLLNIFEDSKAKDEGLNNQTGTAIEGEQVLLCISGVAHACAFPMCLTGAVFPLPFY